LARQEIDPGDLSRARVLWARTLVWLAVIGVFPLSLAQWGPWVIERTQIRFPGDTSATQVQTAPLEGYMGLPNFLFAHGLHNPMLHLGILWLWLAFAPAGIFPALALVWGRGSSWAMRTYIAWLAAVTSLAAIAAIQLFGVTPRAICYGPGGCPTITLVSRQPGWGAWVTLGALALLWVAAAARLFAPRAAFAPYSLAQEPERVDARYLPALRRFSAAAFTLGALIWGFGLILVPWATHNCTGFPIAWTHFVRGSCAGLDANDAIPFVWPANTMEHALDFTMFLVFMGLLGIVAMGALWRKGWGGPVVAAIWAALATWLFLQVRTGLAALLEHPTQLTFATSGAWVSGSGPLVTGAGLALACIGVIGAWLAAIDSFRRKGHANDPAPLPEAASAESL
jgi:hypothetical protein